MLLKSPLRSRLLASSQNPSVERNRRSSSVVFSAEWLCFRGQEPMGLVISHLIPHDSGFCDKKPVHFFPVSHSWAYRLPGNLCLQASMLWACFDHFSPPLWKTIPQLLWFLNDRSFYRSGYYLKDSLELLQRSYPIKVSLSVPWSNFRYLLKIQSSGSYWGSF